MNAIKIIGIGLLSIIFLCFLTFGLSEVGLIHYQFFAPKYAKVQRRVFENTPSYVQGKIQDLSNYKLQYDTTKDTGSRSAIKAVIRTQFANFNIDDCPDDLKPFLEEARGY